MPRIRLPMPQDPPLACPIRAPLTKARHVCNFSSAGETQADAGPASPTAGAQPLMAPKETHVTAGIG